MATGYSGRPLAKKLGVKDGQRTWRYGMPASVCEEIELSVGPMLLKSPESGLEMAHIFVTRRSDLSKILGELRDLLERRHDLGFMAEEGREGFDGGLGGRYQGGGASAWSG